MRGCLFLQEMNAHTHHPKDWILDWFGARRRHGVLGGLGGARSWLSSHVSKLPMLDIDLNSESESDVSYPY